MPVLSSILHFVGFQYSKLLQGGHNACGVALTTHMHRFAIHMHRQTLRCDFKLSKGLPAVIGVRIAVTVAMAVLFALVLSDMALRELPTEAAAAAEAAAVAVAATEYATSQYPACAAATAAVAAQYADAAAADDAAATA